MSAFFANRTQREKLLLALMATLALLWLTVAQVWVPLQTYRRETVARIPRIERAILHIKSSAEPQLPQATDPRAASAIVTEAAAAFGLKISRLQPQDTQTQLTLEDAPFETVVLWIEALQRDDALRLVDLTLTRRSAPGVVGTTLTLAR